MTTYRINSYTTSQIAAEILQRAAECKKPVYLYKTNIIQGQNKALEICDVKPPYDNPSIVAAPNDTLNTVESRVSRLYKL